MKKILTVIGARPQFIKASVVSNAIAKTSGLTEVVVHTGQHYDANMSEVFFAELGMRAPDCHLGIGGGGHGEMTGRMLQEIEKVLLSEKPDAVLVYGDTNSTLAGALAAAKLHIPVAHVEAGLRSFNMRMPEEINRILTDRISSWLFTPTEAAVQHLRSEGVAEQNIIPVGDVMFDAARFFGERAQTVSRVLQDMGLESGAYVLVTVHRAENTDDVTRLRSILQALREVSETIDIVWPVHPRTRNILQQNGFAQLVGPRMRLIAPVGYLDMVMLEQNAALIATDSGGVQKEAFFHQVPCVTLRDETEWVELVTSGWNTLVPISNPTEVANAIMSKIGSEGDRISPYGEGNASRLIAERLVG